jgi:hypothetical protein
MLTTTVIGNYMIKYLTIMLLSFALFACSDKDKNEAPTAEISTNGTPQEQSSFSLSALNEKDPEGDPLSYAWKIKGVHEGVEYVTKGSEVMFNIDDIDRDLSFDVTLSLSDDHGNITNISHSVSIENNTSTHSLQYPSVSSAIIKISDKDGNLITESTSNTEGKWNLDNNFIDSDTVYIITVSGGVLASNDDNLAKLHTIVEGGSLKSNNIVTSIFTDAVYLSVERLINKITSDELLETVAYNETKLHKDTSNLTEGQFLSVSTKRIGKSLDVSLLHNELSNAVTTENETESILSAYQLLSGEALFDQVINLFNSHITFNMINSSIVESRVLELVLWGEGKIGNSALNISIDTSAGDSIDPKSFIIPKGTNEVVLTLKAFNDYTVHSWKGCASFTGTGQCVVDLTEDASVRVILERPPIYVSNYYDLANYQHVLDQGIGVYFYYNEDTEEHKYLKRLKVGDYISSNNENGYIRLITDIVIDGDKIYYFTDEANLPDIIESGTLVVDRQITNADVARQANYVNASKGYQANKVVALNKNKTLYALLSDDGSSTDIVLLQPKSKGQITTEGADTYDFEGNIGKFFSAPTNVKLTTSAYFDSNLFSSGALIKFAVDKSINLTSTPQISVTIETSNETEKKYGDEKILIDNVIASFPSTIGYMEFRLKASIYYSTSAKASILAGYTFNASASGGISYDSDNGGDAYANSHSDANSPRFAVEGEASITGGLDLSTFVGINAVEIPVSLFANGSATGKVILQVASNGATQCKNLLWKELHANYKAGLRLETKMRVFGVSFDLPLVGREFALSDNILLYAAPVNVDKDMEECYNPTISITKISNDDDDRTQTHTYEVKNTSKVTAYYSAALARYDAPANITYDIPNRDGNGGGSIGNADEISISPDMSHRVKVKFDKDLMAIDKTYINKFTIKHVGLPLYGAESLKNVENYSISISPHDISALSIPYNVSASAQPNRHNVKVRWEYEETYLDKIFPRKFKITRISPSGQQENLGEIYINGRYFHDRVPSYGKYTYKVSVISGEYITQGSSTSVETYSSYVGTYNGTYTWDCGLWSDGFDENNEPIYYQNTGSMSAFFTIHSDEFGLVNFSTNLINTHGQNVAQRRGNMIYFGDNHMNMESSSSISGASYNGPECSHPTIYWGAGKFSLYK